MARVCQLTDDLKYYLCMEPVDMQGKMVNNKVNDMFEQQQNTGKIRLWQRNMPMP